MSVHIVTDSASDLPKDVVAERGITVVPLTVRFGDDREIVDGSITPEDFWARCNSSAVLPQTSAPSAGDFEEAFRKAAAAGADGVVCVTLASGLSATFSAASAAAESVKDDISVRVVDSRTASLGEGLITLAAAEAAESGVGVEEVEAATQAAASRTKVFAALDTLEFLKKGGRIGGAQAFLGSLLSIKPIIEVGSVVEPDSKQRTRGRAMQYLADKVKAAGPLERLGVVHGRAADVDEFTDLLEEFSPKGGIMVSDVGAVIGAHSGPRLLGVTFQRSA
ncbi:MAG TPA: DegV family protein [Acidimicrobiales bacterium]|nr:DegV family protein [Acidimicrobiales bacterium]